MNTLFMISTSQTVHSLVPHPDSLILSLQHSAVATNGAHSNKVTTERGRLHLARLNGRCHGGRVLRPAYGHVRLELCEHVEGCQC